MWPIVWVFGETACTIVGIGRRIERSTVVNDRLLLLVLKLTDTWQMYVLRLQSPDLVVLLHLHVRRHYLLDEVFILGLLRSHRAVGISQCHKLRYLRLLLNHLIWVHLLLVQVLMLVMHWLGGMLHDELIHLCLAHGKVCGEVWLLLLRHRIEVILLHLLVNNLLLVGLSLQVFLIFCIKARQPCIVLLF